MPIIAGPRALSRHIGNLRSTVFRLLGQQKAWAENQTIAISDAAHFLAAQKAVSGFGGKYSEVWKEIDRATGPSIAMVARMAREWAELAETAGALSLVLPPAGELITALKALEAAR